MRPFWPSKWLFRERDAIRSIAFRTNVEDSVTVDADHPLRFETEERTDGLKPYVQGPGRSGSAGQTGTVFRSGRAWHM
jgi:hypothetical protein